MQQQTFCRVTYKSEAPVDVFSINDSSPLQLIIKTVEGGSLLKGRTDETENLHESQASGLLSQKPSSVEDYFLLFGNSETVN